MMDPNAILGLLSDLYGQINHLAQQNAELTRLLSEKPDGPPTPGRPERGTSVDDLDGLYRGAPE